MKLKDYLKQFEGMDPEADMIFKMSDGCCGDTFDLADPDVDIHEALGNVEPEGQKWVVVHFPALEFLKSCIRSGTAQRAVQMLLDANKAISEKKH